MLLPPWACRLKINLTEVYWQIPDEKLFKTYTESCFVYKSYKLKSFSAF